VQAVSSIKETSQLFKLFYNFIPKIQKGYGGTLFWRVGEIKGKKLLCPVFQYILTGSTEKTGLIRGIKRRESLGVAPSQEKIYIEW